MLTSTLKRRGARVAAGLAAASLAIGASVLGGPPAGADPKQLEAFVTVGSDTTQDVLNGLAGHANGAYYEPLHSTNGTQVISFDAVPPAGVTDSCITTKVKAATIYRSNGSTEGRRALSRAIDGTGYGPAALCGGTKDVSGLVDFARSSSGPDSGDTGTALTYIPFARDALSFGYYRAAGSPVTQLTRGQLTSLFTTGPQVISGVRIVPCGIQTGSGTFKSWNKVTTASEGQEDVATTECNALLGVPHPSGRVQENSGAQLKTKGNLLAAQAGHGGDQVVVGFSASNFIAQCNGAVTDDLGTNPGTTSGADLGNITDNGSGTALGVPYQAVGGGTGVCKVNDLEPVSGFYSDGVFGRNVYNVFDTAVIDSAFGNAQIKSIFKGATAAVCTGTGQVTVRTFGFLTPSNCGSNALKGSLISGIQ